MQEMKETSKDEADGKRIEMRKVGKFIEKG